MDIAKCFDRIDHKHPIKRVIAPQGVKQGLWRCLNSGTNPSFPNQGVPQGGVISPLLANISLNGIEKLGNCIRYADDLVFIIDPGICQKRIERTVRKMKEEIEYEVIEFLKKRGLEIKQSKTKLVKATDGFDFLGWNFYVQKANWNQL